MGTPRGLLLYPFSGNPAYRQVLQTWGPTAYGAEPAAHGYAHWHMGVDFAVPEGTTLLAAAAGLVIHAGPDVSGAPNGGYGTCVALEHENSLYTLYGHMKSVSVSPGQIVTQGQSIGLSDSSGNSSGPHLHFGVFRTPAVFGLSGDINPLDLLADTPDSSGLPSDGVLTTISANMAVYLARHAGIPDGQLATAVAIAMAESSLRIDNVNAQSGAAGLWQILPSAHPEYTVARLTSDPQYNADAMAAISSKGTNWRPWETYTSGAYRSYLPGAEDAVRATPASTRLSDLEALPGGPLSFGGGSEPAADVPLPPAPPPNPFAVVPVTVTSQALIPQGGTLPTAYLWINNVFLPVIGCQMTQPTYRNPGQFSATLSTLTLETADGQKVMDALFTRAFTQVVLYLGYVTQTRRFDPTRLAPAFTGIVDPPRFDYGSYQVQLAGPDLSGVFTDPSATAVDPGSLGNQPADKAIQSIIDGHKGKGVTGITLAADPVAGTVGGIFGQGNDVVTRGAGQTEWDTMVAIAQGEGCALWFQGTTLNLRRVPSSLPPQVLPYGAAKKPSLLAPPVFLPQPHAKRFYYVQATSYDTTGGAMTTASAGNPDSTNVITVPYQPNVPADRLQRFANDALAAYEATEIQADLETAGIVPLAFGQPLVIDSDEIDPRFVGRSHPYYPASLTYRYSQDAGITMSIKATNRPLGLQTANTAASLGV